MAINDGAINNTTSESVSSSSSYTSFSNEFIGEYAFKSSVSGYFNFHSLACGTNNYGNILKKHNFDDLPNIDISKYEKTFRNGGKIRNKTFTDFIFDIEFEITAPGIEELNTELQNIKKFFNNGGKIFKRVKDKIKSINVVLDELKIGEKYNTGTKIEATFLSLDPFFKDITTRTLIYEDNTDKIDASLVISDSDEEVDYTVIFSIHNANLTKLKLDINGYWLEINENLSGDVVVKFNGKTGKITSGGVEYRYKGVFNPIPINKVVEFKTDYEGTLDDYDVYILYDKISL